ncbi:MAG: hypothetical protein AAF466_08095 [Bacteroidota bacterium]
MKRSFKLFLAVCIVPLAMLANNNPKFKGKYTKTKTLNKEYSVNSEAELEVSNSYGNIDIVTWNESRTVIEVVITTNGDNEEKVQEKLNKIDVDFSGTPSKVTAKTIFKDRKGNSWSWWGKNKNKVKMQINYTIKLPVTNSVDLSNDYGAININNLDGQARISCDYGQINIGSLNASNNDLSFDYTKNSTIGYMKSGEISADYSGFTLDKTDGLRLNADYSRSDIGEVGELNYSCDYGKLIVGDAGKIIGQGDYIPLKVSTLSGDLDVSSDYGSITVDRINNGDITIESDYAGIKLGYASSYNFDFVLNLEYASLKGGDDLEIMKQIKDHSDKYYSGYHGSQNSGNKINIDSEYGSVTLYKN